MPCHARQARLWVDFARSGGGGGCGGGGCGFGGCAARAARAAQAAAAAAVAPDGVVMVMIATHHITRMMMR